MGGAVSIACVVYGAKSTTDPRGSIPDQLRQCREAIERDAERALIAEYTDVSFSAYSGDRGPGLLDAMQHAEDLARQLGTAELWVQHSDRLARGDGRVARHAVEIALWALKHDIRVCSLQDPDTFRDLLYAVVTGHRNHEDSRRRGLALAAGRRRAASRGEFIGYVLDGYRVVVEVDDRGGIRRRIDFDETRRPVIEVLFGLALRGIGPAAIATRLNDAGWRTNPRRRNITPVLWRSDNIVAILRNPRYAGLSTYHGEVLGPAQWPGYVTPRQHERLKAQAERPRHTTSHRQNETYLLAQLGRCGRCGSPLWVFTGHPRKDGTFCRRYICANHSRGPWRGRCPAQPMSAELIEAMFVAAIRTLLGGDEDNDPLELLARSSAGRHAVTATERQRLAAAMASQDAEQLEAELQVLFMQMQPDAEFVRAAAISTRHRRQLEAIPRFQAWAEHERIQRTNHTREETRRLNRLLRSWLAGVEVTVSDHSVDIVARRAGREGTPEGQAAVEFDRREWARFASLARRPHRRMGPWNDPEIIGAIQAWADAHGRSPTWTDWRKGEEDHPTSPTLMRRFKTWDRALDKAGLTRSVPETPPRNYQWDDADILAALSEWTRNNGRPPAWADWLKATPQRFCSHWAWTSEVAPVWTLEVAPPLSDRPSTVLGSSSSSGRGRKEWDHGWNCSSRSGAIAIARGCPRGRWRPGMGSIGGR